MNSYVKALYDLQDKHTMPLILVKYSDYVGQPTTTTLHTFALSNLFEVSF